MSTTIQFYGKALNASGKIEQLLVTKVPGMPMTQAWTGKVYKSDRAADADVTALNVEIARQTRSFERMAG